MTNEPDSARAVRKYGLGNDPALKDKAWSVAFEYVLRRGWLTSRQIKHAMDFGWKAANREAK